jgi:hypothetical protein
MRKDWRDSKAVLASAEASLRQAEAARNDLQQLVQESIARLHQSEALLATPVYGPVWTRRRSAAD